MWVVIVFFLFMNKGQLTLSHAVFDEPKFMNEAICKEFTKSSKFEMDVDDELFDLVGVETKVVETRCYEINKSE